MKRKTTVDREGEEDQPTAGGEVQARRRIIFDNDSDSENEVFFNTQANKRSKMSEMAELKIWFRAELDSNEHFHDSYFMVNFN